MFFLNRKNIQYKKLPKLSGLPIFIFHPKAKLKLGSNITLHSNRFTYHLHMNSPVKIMIDHPNAQISIGNNTRLNGCCLHARESITIGDNCLIAANTQIFDNNGHDLSMDKPEARINTFSKPKPITIGNNVWVGYNCLIMPGVKIGDGSVIAAGSVVNKDIPSNCVAGGNPINVIKQYE